MTTTTIQEAIAKVCDENMANQKKLKKELRAIRWALKAGTGYAGLSASGNCMIVRAIEDASIFTGLDNEELKARFWSIQLGMECVPTLIA